MPRTRVDQARKSLILHSYLKPISIFVQLLDDLLCAAVLFVFAELEVLLQDWLDSTSWVDLAQ